MPHPQTHPLVGLPFFELLQVSGTDPIAYEVRLTQAACCPHCKSERLPAEGLHPKAEPRAGSARKTDELFALRLDGPCRL